jgi:hypothetical protein
MVASQFYKNNFIYYLPFKFVNPNVDEHTVIIQTLKYCNE